MWSVIFVRHFFRQVARSSLLGFVVGVGVIILHTLGFNVVIPSKL